MSLKKEQTKIATVILERKPEGKFTAIWFMRDPKDGSLVGPYTIEALKDALAGGEVLDTFEVWNPKSFTSWSSFQSFPELVELKKQLDRLDKDTEEPTLAEESASQIWFIHTSGGTDGPFSMESIRQMAKAGLISPPLFCWKKGFKEWVVYSKVEELKDLFERKDPKSQAEKRKAKRAPLLASVELKNGTYLGVIRNISVTGLQVLGRAAPGPVDSVHQVQVVANPVYGLPKLTAEIRIVRPLVDRVGFCCKFVTIPKQLLGFLLEQVKS